MRKATVFAVIALSLLGFVTTTSLGQGVGDYASGAAPKHLDWRVPPGHFGLLAGYANDFLSAAPANGSYVIGWSALVDSTDDPELADQLDDFFILDIRGKTTFDAGHLLGATNIPYAEVAKPWNLEKLPAGPAILVVCGSGALSSQVAAALGMMGYNVRVLTGGMSQVPANPQGADHVARVPLGVTSCEM